MTTLFQLPYEMITEIWGHILEPRDLESFAMVSKRIYAKCGLLVKEHNKLKREYSVFESRPNTRASAPAILLKKVLLRPRLALYVTHLSIGRYEAQWQDPDRIGDEDIPYSKEWPETRHTPYPDEDMALFKEGLGNFLAGPNEVLDCITLKSFKSYRDDPFGQTIEQIARDKYRRYLARLTTVKLHIPSWQSDKESQTEWYWLNILASLPTVQTLYVKGLSVLGKDEIPTGEKFFEPGTSKITEMTFIESGVAPKMMFDFLESITELKRFSYVKLHEHAFHKFEPFRIRAALLANAKHSLEYLRITSSEVDERKILGDFRGFAALRELEANVHHLLPRVGDKELADLLPASIENLHLHTQDDGTTTIVPLLIIDLRKAKLRRLHNWRALKLSTVYEFGATQSGMRSLKTSVAICRAVGIELTVVTPCSPVKEQVAVPGSNLEAVQSTRTVTKDEGEANNE